MLLDQELSDRPKLAYLVFIARESRRSFKRLRAGADSGQSWQIRQSWHREFENFFYCKGFLHSKNQSDRLKRGHHRRIRGTKRKEHGKMSGELLR